MTRSAVSAWTLIALLRTSSLALGQGEPLGPEFRVNTYTSGRQNNASVASDAAGNFVVLWEANQDGSNSGVFAQRYDSAGSALGGEFRVNTYTPHSQDIPAVASDSSGNFVVVWQSYGQDGWGLGVFGQRFSAIAPPGATILGDRRGH